MTSHMTIDKRGTIVSITNQQLKALLSIAETIFNIRAGEKGSMIYENLNSLFQGIYTDENDLFWLDHKQAELRRYKK